MRAGQHSLVDLLLVSRAQRRCVLTAGQCATLTGEVVARCTVQAEQIGTTGNVCRVNLTILVVGTTQGLHGDLAISIADDARAATVSVNVSCQRQSLLLGVARGLTLGLCLVAQHRHAAGVYLEVHSAFTDTNQGRTAILNALQVATVAGDTSNLVNFLTLLRQLLRALLGNRVLRIRGQCVGEEARARKREQQCQRAGEGLADLPAAACLGGTALRTTGDLLRGCVGGVDIHLVPLFASQWNCDGL